MRKALIICLLLPLAVGGLAAALTQGSMEHFAALAQPPLSPPGWVFPVVWSALYLLMGAASFLVWKADAPQAEKTRALVLYGVQLATNLRGRCYSSGRGCTGSHWSGWRCCCSL